MLAHFELAQQRLVLGGEVLVLALCFVQTTLQHIPHFDQLLHRVPLPNQASSLLYETAQRGDLCFEFLDGFVGLHFLLVTGAHHFPGTLDLFLQPLDGDIIFLGQLESRGNLASCGAINRSQQGKRLCIHAVEAQGCGHCGHAGHTMWRVYRTHPRHDSRVYCARTVVHDLRCELSHLLDEPLFVLM